MKKIFRLLVWIFVVVPVLLISLALVVPRFIDPDDYRDQIADVVRKQTGRKLSIDGGLSVSLFPWVGVRGRDVSLAQPASVGEGEMLSVAEVDIRVKVAPLLRRIVEVDTVVLREPVLSMIIMPDGSSSTDGLVPAPAAPSGGSGKVDSPDSPEPGAPTGAAITLAVHGVKLERGQLVWDDRENDQRIEISNLNISTGELLGDVPGEFSISGNYDDGSAGDTLEFVIDGLAGIDANSIDARMEDVNLSAVRGGDVYTATVDTVSLSQKGQRIDVTGVRINVNAGADAAVIEMAALTLDQAVQTLSIPQATVRLAGMELRAVISGAAVLDGPELTGTINTNVFSPAMVIESIEAEYRPTDPAALTTMSLSADFRATSDQLDLDNLDINLDESEFRGSLGVSGFDDPAIVFDLALDGIDIDRYLPVVEEGEGDLSQIRVGAALVLPVAMFRDLNANGNFTADRLIAGGLRVEEIELDVSSTGNTVTIKPSAKLYGGILGGTMRYTNLGDSENLVISETIEGVQLAGLLADAGVTDRLSGRGSLGIDFEVTAAGGNQTILGSMKVLARDGALKGVDIKQDTQPGGGRLETNEGRESGRAAG